MSEPTMSDVLQQIAEITATVKDGGLVDTDKVAAALEPKITELVDAQVREKLDARPLRRISGTLIGPDGQKIAPANRYHKFLAGFEKDGYYRWGNHKTQPIDLWLTKALLDKAHYYNPQQVKAASDELSQVVKALTSTGAGTGDEYVPTDMAAGVWEDMFLASRIANTLQPVPMTSDPFDWPLGLGSVVWRKGTQNTATTHSDPATAKSTFTTTELVTEQQWSYTLDEDAVVAIMPLLRAEIARSGGEKFDDFAYNADSTNAGTGNINSDDADPDDTSYYLSDGQDGIRHLWIVDNTGQQVAGGGAALTDAMCISAMNKLGKYAVDPMDCVWTCDISTYIKGFLSAHSNSPGANVLTIDKFGPQATVLTGQLASYRGIPIIPSSIAPKTEADGKVSATPASNTLGQLSLYNRRMWGVGYRRQLLIEVDRLIQNRQMVMVTSFRQAVGCRGTRSTATHTAGVLNISLA